jgi:hypothetical protein
MENKNSVFGWLIGLLTTVIASGWAVFTYAVPDPSVLGVSFINWKNILLLLCFLVSSIWLFLYFWSQRLPAILKHFLIIALYITSAAGFFWIGTKFQDPLFGSSKMEAEYVYNDSATIIGERVEGIENVTILLRGCQKVIGQIACRLEFVNNGADREIGFHGDTRAFDDASNELELTSLVVGTSPMSPGRDFSLPKGVNTKVVVAFNSANDGIKQLTSLRLRFSGMSGVRKGVKFDGVILF